ncbi:F-box domain [Arabidopsis suecica]|uniref:F-box domain n=1 Tax=Arabidopsis suecica TaxID=45249 RepID=A0A8T2B7V1_ARASU|nr:F-box domain [Arabidopsis suecica]
MSYPERKRKKTRWSPPLSTPNPSLPDDLLLSIFARVSRLYYPTLSLVSKSFRSLLASPELYKTRSLSGNTEICLYVCLRCCSGYRWFTLCRKPDQTITNNKERKSSGYALARVPILGGSPNVRSSSLVAVGSDIYNICGSINKASPSSSVSILDCRSHKWREAPSLPVELCSVSASVLDQKIYVAGCYNQVQGNGYPDSRKNSFEVLDTKTQIWETKPVPCCSGRIYNFFNSKSTCIDGKFYVVTEDRGSEVAYNSKEGRWDSKELGMGGFMFSDSYCEIDNVLYSVYDGAFRWYDTEVREWKDLNGLFQLPKFSAGACVRLADYGGKMAVLWDQLPYHYGYQKEIHCAVVERPTRYEMWGKSCEIWGKVEWCDLMLTVPTSYVLVKVLAATL